MKITESLIQRAVSEEQYEKAVTNITHLLEDCTQSVNLICLKIECLMKGFKFEEADKYSAKVMKGNESIANNPRVLCNRGKVLIYTGNDVLGKKFLQQALSFDPDLKECQQGIKMIKRAANLKEDGAALFKDGKFKEAIEQYKACLELDPLNSNYNSQILLNTAICQVKLGQNEEAIKSLNLAIKYNPKYAKAYVKRGEVRLAMEEYNEAIRDFSDAAEHDPSGFNVQAKMKDAQDKAKKAKRKDYYKILGVDKNATDPEINKAYKKLALKWHPDKNSQTEESREKAEKMIKDLNEAKNVLTDKDKRRKYDQGFDLEDINSGKADMGDFGAAFGGMDPSDLLGMFMGGMGGMGGGRGRGRRP